MEKSEIIRRMMLILELIKITKEHCSIIETEIGDFEFDKPVFNSRCDLERIYSRLEKNLKGYCGKDVWGLRGTVLDMFDVTVKKRKETK